MNGMSSLVVNRAVETQSRCWYKWKINRDQRQPNRSKCAHDSFFLWKLTVTVLLILLVPFVTCLSAIQTIGIRTSTRRENAFARNFEFPLRKTNLQRQLCCISENQNEIQIHENHDPKFDFLSSTYPSRQYQIMERNVKVRQVDWCGSSMLPLQVYSCGAPKDHNQALPIEDHHAFDSFTSYNGNVTKFLEDLTTTATTKTDHENRLHFNQMQLSLSKSSQHMLHNFKDLSLVEQERLMQKILSEQRATQPLNATTSLQILYCDEHICVTNKPSGILSVPGPRRNPSLANLVFDNIAINTSTVDEMVVHRLDMATSGILVYAFTKQALKQLHDDFANRGGDGQTRPVQKTYQALVHGHLSCVEGEISVSLERDPTNPPFMRIAQQGDNHDDVSQPKKQDNPSNFFPKKASWSQPKDSLTTFSVLAWEHLKGHPVTRLELRPWTGRTHQLRVHCASALNSPIVGDDIYGVMEKGHENKPNLCLHAHKLCFRHPISRAPMMFQVDPPF